MNINWSIGESKEILKTFIWNVIETIKTGPNGNTGKYVSLQAPDWVSALVFNTDTNKFILNREFRHGINNILTEFPSGTVEPNEDPRVACLREVTEETGYSNARIITQLYHRNPNPAFMNNHMTCYFVTVSGERSSQHLDPNEFINIIETDNPPELIYHSDNDTSVISDLTWCRFEKLFSLNYFVRIDETPDNYGLYHNFYFINPAHTSEPAIYHAESNNRSGNFNTPNNFTIDMFKDTKLFKQVNFWDCYHDDTFINVSES
jgi:8-oxo-dGTP pyrophosphatase MutT (NUDIX family)